MGKAAGIWKKVKNLGKSIGGNFKKAFQWANENIIQPNKDLIKHGLEMVDPTGISGRLVERVSDTVHDYTDPNEVDSTFE